MSKTTEPNLNTVFEEIKKISSKIDVIEKRQDKFEEFVKIQFEAVRKGIVDTLARFDETDSKIYSVRSDISQLKADVRRLIDLDRKPDFGLM